MQQLHPWMIASWPIIERAVEPAPEIAAGLRHLGTTVSGDCDDYGRLLGHTMWGGADSGIGIAWDWVEAVDGVFAMSDPMGIVSNIWFLDKAGKNIPELFATVQLNNITHALPWQSEVANVTQGRRVAEPWGQRVRSSRAKTRAGDGYQRRSALPDSQLQHL